MCGAISGGRRERQGEKRDSRSRKGLGPQRWFKKLLQYNTNCWRVWSGVFICLEIRQEATAMVYARDDPSLAWIWMLVMMLVRSEPLPEVFRRKSCRDFAAPGYTEREMSRMTPSCLCCETCGRWYFSTEIRNTEIAPGVEKLGAEGIVCSVRARWVLRPIKWWGQVGYLSVRETVCERGLNSGVIGI